jgi:hypothetical protein
MSRIFVSPNTGAAVYVFSNDHCPAHVHARHRSDGWIARVSLSFLAAAVELMSIRVREKHSVAASREQPYGGRRGTVIGLSSRLVDEHANRLPCKSVGHCNGPGKG